MATTTVRITAVQIDRDGSIGYYLDDAGTLRHVEIEYGAAIAIQKALKDGYDSVGLEIEQR